MIVASYVSFRAVVFFSGYIFTMWLYSHRIKKLLLWGNLTSASLAIIPFFAVFVYYRNFEAVIFAHALLIFLLILTKEFIKDLQNIKGDLTHNYATIPVVYGERFAKKLITLSILLCFLPIYWLLHSFAIFKLTYFLYFTMLYLLFFVVFLWKSQNQRQYRALHNMLRVILVLGIFSVILVKQINS